MLTCLSYSLSSEHAMRLNSWTGIGGSLISSVIRDRWLLLSSKDNTMLGR